MISMLVDRRAGGRIVALAAAALLLAGCGARSAPAAAPTARPLPADSARLLELAIVSARPAYATQEQALAAGVYRGAALASAARANPPTDRRPSAAAPAPTTPAPETPVRNSPVRQAPPVEVAPRASSPVALLGEETDALSADASSTAPGGVASMEQRVEAATAPSLWPERLDPRGGGVGADVRADAARHDSRSGEPGVTDGLVTLRQPTVADEQPEERSGPIGADAAASGRFVVQIAAFRDLSSAERALADAGRLLTSLPTAIEREAGVFRVIAGGWEDESAARARLPEVRQRYPTAWVRPRTLP